MFYSKESLFIAFKFTWEDESLFLPRSFFLPGQPTRFPRSPIFKVKHSRIRVELDFEKKALAGKVEHTIEPIGSPIQRVIFDATEMSFKSIRVDGVPARYSVEPKSVAIDLGSQLGAGKSITVEIEYLTTPRRGLYFRGPTKQEPGRKLQAFTQGESEDSKYWYPCYDYPNMRTSTETFVTVPQSMAVVSNGRLVGVSEPDAKGKKTWHFEEEMPHSSYMTSLVAGEFVRTEETHGPVLIQYFLPPDKEALARRSFEKTPKIIDFFERVTGQKYPYSKYAQSVVSDFMFGGMENISATTLTERTLHTERAHLDFASESLVAHELAHQWFGDLLTCKDWSNAWLNEGFATYFDSLFKEDDMGEDEFQYFMMRSPAMENFFAETERYQRPIVTKRYWDADELFDYHTYEKGSWVLNCLRGTLGDEVFFRGIKSYVAKYKNSLVETFDFRKAMEEASGIDLESFFDQWLYCPGFPEYAVNYAWNQETKNAEVTVEQTNAESEGVPLFSNPIEIRFTLENGSKILRKIRMETKKQAFFFSLDTRPLNVNFDPKNWILKKLKFHKPIEMHLYQLKHDDNAMERVRACQELAGFSTEDVVRSLGDSIDQDKFWGVRLEAGRALGKIGTKAALEVLLSKAGHKDHKARRGVAAGLRGFYGVEEGESAVEALIKMLENDESYYTRAFAAYSLGYYKKSERVFEALKNNLAQDSHNDIVRFGIFQGFGEMGDPRAIPLAIDYLEHGKHFYGRMFAAYALGRLGKGNAKALDALLEVNIDGDVYVKEAAAESVALLNDTSAIPSLEEWLEKEMEGRVRRMLRESIHNLRERVLQTESLSKIGGDLEKVTSEAKKAEERIAALEASVKHNT